jgi:hypothetical protein
VKIFQTGLIVSASIAVAIACSGEDGKDGKTGAPGAQGEDGPRGPEGATGMDGPTGPEGPPGADGATGPEGPPGAGGAGGVPDGTLTASCMTPCHGFSGIVEQWKTSRHFSAYVANLDGEEVESWTGAKSCGNCHAIDGVEQRVAENVTYKGTTPPVALTDGQLNYEDDTSTTFKLGEISYAGQATVAAVHCFTCHDSSEENDPHFTGEDYVAGNFPLRVPSGSGSEAIVERSSMLGTSDGTAVAYRAGNACVWCHKSRKDVTNYILEPTSVTSTTWGPHHGPHADVYSGAGGYEYAGMMYGQATHAGFVTGCVQCHMPNVTTNGMAVPNHSFYAQISACQGCHAGATNFDILGGQSNTKTRLRNLRTLLNNAGYLTQDGVTPLTPEQVAEDDFDLDESLPQSAPVPKDTAGALYNYFIVARGSAFGVHNPKYVYQLLFDSITELGGTPGFSRPPP